MMRAETAVMFVCCSLAAPLIVALIIVAGVAYAPAVRDIMHVDCCVANKTLDAAICIDGGDDEQWTDYIECLYIHIEICYNFADSGAVYKWCNLGVYEDANVAAGAFDSIGATIRCSYNVNDPVNTLTVPDNTTEQRAERSMLGLGITAGIQLSFVVIAGIVLICKKYANSSTTGMFVAKQN